MECAEALDWISEYADMPADDPLRQEIERHLQDCESCTEQYNVWNVSEQWDEDMTDWSLRAIDWDNEVPAHQFRPEDVMERIYNDIPWFTPAHRRGNRMSPRMRNIFAGIVSFCLAVFLSGLLALAVTAEQPMAKPATGIVPTVVVGSVESEVSSIEMELPDFGANDPVLLDVVPTVPQYWIALSLFGISLALLLLNWLTRAKE
ncbi:zf-HC2 domain-containing protein [Paenibacillus marinisediminis]